MLVQSNSVTKQVHSNSVTKQAGPNAGSHKESAHFEHNLHTTAAE